MPRVSVIIPVYNGEETIERAIRSVLSQTFQDFELILIDDGSMDKSFEILERCRRDHPDKISLNTHANHENLGIVETYQSGFSKARGEYLAFVEQDDTWVKNYLEEKIRILEQYPNVGVAFSRYMAEGENWGALERVLRWCQLGYLATKKKPLDLTGTFLKKQIIGTFSCFVTRKALIDTIPQPSLRRMVAFDWWVLAHLSINNLFFCDSKTFVLWRKSKKSFFGGRTGREKRRIVACDLGAIYQSLSKLVIPGDSKKRKLIDRHMKCISHYQKYYTSGGLIDWFKFFRCHPVWSLETAFNYLIIRFDELLLNNLSAKR